MRPTLLTIPFADEGTVKIETQNGLATSKEIHYHSEIQLTLVAEGSGRMQVGDILVPLQPGTLLLIGDNLPHAMLPQPRGVTQDVLQVLHLYLRKDWLGKLLDKLPELAALRLLLRESRRGILFPHAFGQQLYKRINTLRQSAGLERLSLLFELLHRLVSCPERSLLANTALTIPEIEPNPRRMQRILDYIAKNFDQPISLEEMASYVHLSKYAFCRYFKQLTNKSFVAYLNEFRTGRACRLLAREQYSVSQIGYLVGFNNLSNFNRQFKKFMNCTPSAYRKWILSGNTTSGQY